MKLGLFHPAFATLGGAEVLAATHAAYLRSIGHDVEILTFLYEPESWSAFFSEIPVRMIPKRNWKEIFYFWDRLAKLRSRSRRAEPHMRRLEGVIAYNYPCSTMVGQLGSKVRKIWHCNEPPRALHPRETQPYMTAMLEAQNGAPLSRALALYARELAAWEAQASSRRTFRWRLEHDRESIEHLDHVWALSSFTRDNLRRVYGDRQVDVIHPMVRFPDAPQRRRELNRDGLEILVHSRLEHFKNIDTVLRGFQQFCEQSSGTHHLHVVGEGREREFLEGLARDLALTKRVTFHGYLPEEELSRVYERCDVLTLLTLDEPFGMVFPEAAARGLLLIGPDHGGPLEILEGGALGWCVPALSSEALCVALQEVRALSTCDVARRRRAADRSCRERFGRDAIGRRLSELLVEACPV